MAFTDSLVEFTRIYLALFFTAVAGFYALRITLKKRRVAAEVVFPGKRFGTTWWNHMIFRVFRATIWLVCVLRWLFPAVDDYLGMLSVLNKGLVIVAGDILLTAGFVVVLVVHFTLGKQWRSGIDPAGPQRLLTDSFYKYSRNPMFVGVATAQLGFFLALPSLFSGACLLIGVYTLYRQTLAEEAHLLRVFPEEYPQYQARVRRWL